MATTATTASTAGTSTTAGQPDAGDRRPRDLRQFWRIVLAILLPVGPLLITVTRATMPYWTSDEPATVVEKSLANPAPLELGAWLLLFAVPALLVGVITIGYLARRAAPVLATVGSVLAFAGFAGIGSVASTDAVLLAGGEVGLDATTIERLTTAMTNHPAAAVGVGMFIVGHILGLVLLGVALWRARVVPRWVAIAVAVSQPIHLVSAVIVPSRLLDVVLGWGLTTVAFAAIALVVLRMRDDEWDAAPRAAAG